MSVADLTALAAELAPKPVDITVNPTVDQAALDFLYKDQLGAEAHPTMTPRINTSALEAVRALMGAPVSVPLIPTGYGGSSVNMGVSDIGKKELLSGKDINGNGIIGAKYGLDMTVPSGFRTIALGLRSHPASGSRSHVQAKRAVIRSITSTSRAAQIGMLENWRARLHVSSNERVSNDNRFTDNGWHYHNRSE